MGGHLYLDKVTSIQKSLPPKAIFWQDGKYVKVDGVFTEVLHKRGNVYEVKKLSDENKLYLVTDGEDRWAHGETIKEAKLDLLFKISNKCVEDYKGLTLDNVLSFGDAIECYRIITGACSFGVKDFVNEFKIEERDYSVGEMINLTKDAYGGENFKYFFK